MGITVANYIATGQTTYLYFASAGIGLVIGITAYYIVHMVRDP